MTSSTSILGHLTQFRGRLRSSGLSPKPRSRSCRCDRNCSAPIRWSVTARRSRPRIGVTPRPGAGPAPAAVGRERKRADRRLQAAGRGDIDEPPDHPGGRVAARQLPSDRRTDRHRQEALAARLQPGAAAPGARSVGGSAARIRHRARGHLARRRPGRRRQPAALRRRLPIGYRRSSSANCGRFRSCCGSP